MTPIPGIVASSVVATSFNLVTGLPWTHLFYAGGPEFVALGIADGGAVGTWPDEIGTLDATQGTAGAKPTNRLTGGANSKPAVEADGGDRLSNAGSAPQEIAQPLTLVTVGKTDTTAGGTFAAGGNSGSDRCQSYISGGSWAWFAGNQVFIAGANTNWHLHVQYFNGASSYYELDGTSISTGNPGTQPHQGVSLFADNSGAGLFDGMLAVHGIFTGEAKANGNWAAFETWVASEYGITIS